MLHSPAFGASSLLALSQNIGQGCAATGLFIKLNTMTLMDSNNVRWAEIIATVIEVVQSECIAWAPQGVSAAVMWLTRQEAMVALTHLRISVEHTRRAATRALECLQALVGAPHNHPVVQAAVRQTLQRLGPDQPPPWAAGLLPWAGVPEEIAAEDPAEPEDGAMVAGSSEDDGSDGEDSEVE
jgi:hypothetical protein